MMTIAPAKPRLLLGLVLGLTLESALAAQHLMKVVEVYVGPSGASDAQYVELQMYAGGQNQVQGHAVQVLDNTDQVLGTFTFSSAVSNGANQSSILIATPAAQQRFGVSADLDMTAVIPPAGGKICFDNFDCVSWGNYGGDQTNPSPSGNPFAPSSGLPAGEAVNRDISDGDPDRVENGDDSNDSATDFFVAADPTPRNNAGTVGAEPGSTPAPTTSPAPTASPGAGSRSSGSGGAGGGLLAALLVSALWRRRRVQSAV